MKKGGIYDLKFDSKLSTAGSNVVYQNIECVDIRPSGVYVIKFMYREWVGPLTQLTTQKSTIKLAIDIKEGIVTCLHTDKKKTVYRWDIYQGNEQNKPGVAGSEEDNPVSYSTFSEDSFAPDKYTNELFTHKSDHQATIHLNFLNERKIGCIDHLKKDVYKNHLIFIGASKEIASSEVDMLDFRNLVTEYGNSLNTMQSLSINWDFYKVKKNHKSESGEALTPSTEPIQWLTTVPHELDTAIEQKEFEKAVDIVKKIDDIYSKIPKVEIVMQTHPLKDQIETRIKILIESLMDQLRSPILKPKQIKETIELLVRLEQSDKAKTIFLDSRTHSIQLATKKVNVSGDMIRYIGELTRIIFNAINTTCMDYTNSFPEPYMSSGLIEWVVVQLEFIVDIFKRQVLTNDNYHVVSQLIRIVESHCEMMEQNGLGLSFYWSQLLQPHIEVMIRSYQVRIKDQLLKKLNEDKWIGTSQWDYEMTSPVQQQQKYNSLNNSPMSSVRSISHDTVNETKTSAITYNTRSTSNNNNDSEETKLKLTESTIFFNTILQRFTNDICQLIYLELIPVLSSTINTIFKDFLNYLLLAIQKDLTDSQCHSIISNSVFVCEDLLVRVSNRFEDMTNRPLNNLDTLKDSLDLIFQRILDQYAMKKALILVDQVMMWDIEIYHIDEEIEPFPKKFIKLAEAIDNVLVTIQNNINQENVLPIVSRIVQEIVVIMSERMQLVSERPGFYGYGGLQHFVLEMRYFSTLAGKYIEGPSFELINTMIQNAVHQYATDQSYNPDTVLKPDDFFTSIIDNLVYQKSVYKN